MFLPTDGGCSPSLGDFVLEDFWQFPHIGRSLLSLAVKKLNDQSFLKGLLQISSVTVEVSWVFYVVCFSLPFEVSQIILQIELSLQYFHIPNN